MNKVRKRFVIYAMVAVFVLLTGLLVIINGVNFTMVSEDADRITEMLAKDKGKFREKKISEEFDEKRRMTGMEFMGPDSPELPYTARYFTYRFTADGEAQEVAYHVSVLSREEAENLARRLLHEKTGWILTTYRYRVYKSGDFTYVTAVDQGRELLPSYRILVISAIGECGVLAICLLFLLFISKKLFRPLEETDRKQREFLAEARSEFQVPLTVIHANAELLEKENGSNEYTQAIHRQVKRMTALTRRLDAFSGEKKEESVTCDLSMIVQAATDGALSKYQEKGILLKRDIQDGLLVTGEEEALHKVVAELVENSLRYAKSEVTFSLKREEERIILLTENDTELKDGSAEQVFDRFTKLENARDDVGNGLGLSYVKDIVKAHNGRTNAWIENGRFHLRIAI